MATQVPEELIEAINSYLAGKATPEQQEMVQRWYASFDDSDVEVITNDPQAEHRLEERMRARLQSVVNKPISITRTSVFMRIAAAAVIILISSVAAWFFLQKSDPAKLAESRPVMPGASLTNKVVLTLEDGSRVSVTDAPDGELSRQAGYTINKTADGNLMYFTTQEKQKASAAKNSIQTPAGSIVEVTFPDGSKARINAASSLEFPVAFAADEFTAQLDGEAYFQVTPTQTRKFKVRSGSQITEVLGTTFNINAYTSNPAIKTTLIEGSIRITNLNSNHSTLLKPGQQALFNETFAVSDIEATDAVAWTEGYFQFNNADINTVMGELTRWYGISVKYEGDVSKQKFDGSIDKKLTLQQVLDILGKSQVRFKTTGKTVTVMP